MLSFRDHGKGPDRVTVRYQVPGRDPVTATIDVTESFRAGTTTTVLYVPTSPSTVRTAQAWWPIYTPLRTLYPLVAAVVLGVAVTRARAAHRALRDGMRLRVADRPAVG